MLPAFPLSFPSRVPEQHAEAADHARREHGDTPKHGDGGGKVGTLISRPFKHRVRQCKRSRARAAEDQQGGGEGDGQWHSLNSTGKGI